MGIMKIEEFEKKSYCRLIIEDFYLRIGLFDKEDVMDLYKELQRVDTYTKKEIGIKRSKLQKEMIEFRKYVNEFRGENNGKI